MGLCIYVKRMSRGQFAQSRDVGGELRMTMSELVMYLEGSEFVARETLSPPAPQRCAFGERRRSLTRGWLHQVELRSLVAMFRGYSQASEVGNHLALVDLLRRLQAGESPAVAFDALDRCALPRAARPRRDRHVETGVPRRPQGHSGGRRLHEENSEHVKDGHRHVSEATSGNRPGDMTMKAKQRKNLAKMGGRVTTVREFLGLSDAEVRLVDLRMQLTRELRERRTARKATPAQLAKLLGTSQPRVAAMEAGDPQTSLEALLRALIVLGATLTLKVA
jgi:DNA-binding XRE family transcriptional regulator